MEDESPVKKRKKRRKEVREDFDELLAEAAEFTATPSRRSATKRPNYREPEEDEGLVALVPAKKSQKAERAPTEEDTATAASALAGFADPGTAPAEPPVDEPAADEPAAAPAAALEHESVGHGAAATAAPKAKKAPKSPKPGPSYEPPPKKAPAEACGGTTKAALQQLFNMPYEDGKQLSVASDIKAGRPGYYDHLQVERAWRVASPAAFVTAFESYRDSERESQARTELRAEHAAGVAALVAAEAGALEPPREAANEVLLLHGTTPEVVASLMDGSLEPEMARKGL